MNKRWEVCVIADWGFKSECPNCHEKSQDAYGFGLFASGMGRKIRQILVCYDCAQKLCAELSGLVAVMKRRK